MLFNSRGLSWWAFLLWTLGLIAVAEGYAFFEARLGSRLKALALTGLGYGAALGVVEYLGYVVLEIREEGRRWRSTSSMAPGRCTPSTSGRPGSAWRRSWACVASSTGR